MLGLEVRPESRTRGGDCSATQQGSHTPTRAFAHTMRRGKALRIHLFCKNLHLDTFFNLFDLFVRSNHTVWGAVATLDPRAGESRGLVQSEESIGTSIIILVRTHFAPSSPVYKHRRYDVRGCRRATGLTHPLGFPRRKIGVQEQADQCARQWYSVLEAKP